MNSNEPPPLWNSGLGLKLAGSFILPKAVTGVTIPLEPGSRLQESQTQRNGT